MNNGPTDTNGREMQLIDEAMLPIGEFMSQISELTDPLTSAESQFIMYSEEVELDMPLQLDISVHDGEVALGGSPPLYYVETTVMPVFHQLKIKIGIEKHNGEGIEPTLEP